MRADLRLYMRKVEVAKDRLPSWPHDKLTVLAEQPSIFYDLMTEAMMEQVPAVSNIVILLHAKGKMLHSPASPLNSLT